MKRRCCNPSDESYPDYGGRGITICDRWLNSFENFLADMGEKPSPRHSIDRQNNDLGYSPENCRWATPTEQARNKRSTRMLTFNGETRCIAEWAEILGVRRSTLQARVNSGWSDEQVLDLEIGFDRDYLTFNGKTLHLSEWAKRTGISPGVLYARIHKRGWSVEKALTTPPLKTRAQRSTRLLTFNGQTLGVTEWAERLGIGKSTILWRLNHGWSVEKALTTPDRKAIARNSP